MASDGSDDVTSRDFGRRLAAHRAQRRLSQLHLGLVAGVSARHISFLETGRASPSRDMVGRLAQALDLPAATRDALLASAGFSPRHLRCGEADLLDRAIAIQSAESEGQAISLTRAGLAALGLTHVFVGVLTPAARGAPLVTFGDLRYAHTDWLAHYRDRGFRRDDPFMRATARGLGPFFWSDILRRTAAPPRERQILDEARAFGITAGFVMPTRMADGRVFAVSAMGDRAPDDDPRARWEARLLATAALDRIAAPQGTPA